MATKPSVFISYRRDPSSDLARYIRKELVDAGAHVFLDVDDIDKGRFENVIRSNIENSESFLLLLAPETLQSEWVRREVNHALDNDKNIIPLMMPDFSMEAHVPEELTALRRLHGIPYNHHYAEAALEKVKKAIGVQKRPASLNLWLSKSGCSFQLTIGAVATLLVAVFAAVILPRVNNQNALNVDVTALDRATSIPNAAVTSTSTEMPTPTATPPKTTATQVIDFGATATEAILQLTADSQQATNAALLAENTQIAASATERARATVTGTTTSNISNLEIGGMVTIKLDPGISLNLRTIPGGQNTVVHRLLSGAVATLIDGPVLADNSIWWRVRTSDNVEGWVVESIGGKQLLLPIEETITPTPNR